MFHVKAYEGKNVEPLVNAIHLAHQDVRGTEPPPIDTPEMSMWRDINVFNEVGIPSATFGMPRKSTPDDEERFIERGDIVDAGTMYAVVALRVCS